MRENELRKGLYRVRVPRPLEDYAMVQDINGRMTLPMEQATYRDREIRPRWESLPWLDEMQGV